MEGKRGYKVSNKMDYRKGTLMKDGGSRKMKEWEMRKRGRQDEMRTL